MNVIKKCCVRSLKENRKRTVMTVIGVILATALITGVACLAESFRESLIVYAKQVNGDFHYCFQGVSGENLKYFQNNNNIQRIGLAREVGYAILEGSENPDKPYLYIRAIDEKSIDSMALKLTEGRLPENDEELLIGGHIRYNGMVDLQVGDTLTLQIGQRMSGGFSLDQSNPYSYEEENFNPVQEKAYTVVGILERPNQTIEPRTAPGYSVFTLMDTEDLSAGQFEVYALYTKRGFKNADKVTAGLLGISEELFQKRNRLGIAGYTEEEYAQVTQIASEVQVNWPLLRWQLLRFSNDSTMTMLYGMASLAVVIIILTSVFCIRNSFVISLTEKMKLYGKLASVGTTSKQQRKMVYYEAMVLGMIGIPIGILSGILGTVILVRLVSGLVATAIDIPLVFAVSVPAMLLAAALSAVTILLSAMQSARRAAKVSPISAIRANNSVKINKRELKCPAFINKLFGIGGRIAYRNLRRARRRYRTTVISIVVSVAVFIGLSTFIQLLNMASGIYYGTVSYQIRVDIGNTDGSSYETAQRLARLEGVQQIEIRRTVYNVMTDMTQMPFTDEYCQNHPDEIQMYEDRFGGYPLMIYALGAQGYADYCRNLGVDVSEAQDKAIVLAELDHNVREGGKIYVDKELMADYKKGDMIALANIPDNADISESGNFEKEIEVLLQTDVRPMSMFNTFIVNVVLIVSDQWLDNSPFAVNVSEPVQVYIRCEDAGKMEQYIRAELALEHYTLTNYGAAYQSERAMALVIAIFLYGFITVVALIGITNIFNTITTNMELRAPEFAMLQAVGMTGKEFRRMIWLEGLFYGGKALLIGIPLGFVISYGFHIFFSEGIVTTYQPPIPGVGLSIAAVVLLLYMIMHYSMSKIKRRNIVETIQEENI